MPREIYLPKVPVSNLSVLPVAAGGTGANNANSAMGNLHMVPKALLGKPNGIVQLDANGLIPLSEVPQSIINAAGLLIAGPVTLGIGLTGTYTINNYNATNTYTVTAISGSVMRSGATITYTAPLTTGQSGFIVNGVTTNVNIIDPAQSPTVTGPTSLLENSQGNYVITNYDPHSTYNITAAQGHVTVSLPNITYTAPAGDGIHTLGAGFSINGNNIPVSITPPPVPTFSGPTSTPINTTITISVTNYTPPGTYNVSANVGNVSFSNGTITYTAPSTAQVATITVNGATYTVSVVLPSIATPSIISPVNGATNLGPSVTFTASAFTISGGSDTQKASNWQLATDSGFANIVTQTLNDPNNLTTWTVNNLTANTTYYARVQYIGSNGETSAYSATMSFSTKAVYTPSAITARIASGVPNSRFGDSVSLNSTGNIALIGAFYENTGTGAAYIYTNQSGTWTQTARIASGVANSQFGYSVSLNSAGNIAIIGARYENNYAGAAYIYTNQNGTWTQTARITSGNVGDFGESVSLDSTGTIALIGAPYENNAGLAYIYTNKNGTWTQTGILNGGGGGGNTGISVSLSKDGMTAIVSDSGLNAYYVFYNTNGTWKQTSFAAMAGNNNFGYAVCINSNGTVSLVGYNSNNIDYVQADSINQGFLKTSSNIASSAANNNFGWSNSLDSTGKIALIGAQSENSGTGAAYVYTNQSGTWTQTARLASGVANSYFGGLVSLSSDGTTALIGAPGENSNTGAVYIAQ